VIMVAGRVKVVIMVGGCVKRGPAVCGAARGSRTAADVERPGPLGYVHWPLTGR
jgi:hypothetical protein